MEPVPVEMMTPNAGAVSLGGKEELLSAERFKNQMRTIIWRDKLNLNVGMDCVTLLDKMSKFFEEITSFENDPVTGKTMPNSE